MDGIVNVYKPSGITSHDVIDHLRQVSAQAHVGHAGTLDPMAEGVLVCCLGRASRLVPYIQPLTKHYRGTILFGKTTDTQDADGQVLEVHPAPHLRLEQLREAVVQFTGRLWQVPPMYSAVRVGGRKLHELAREGKKVDREPRPITVYRFEITEFTPGEFPTARFEVECSSGTYVRTLAHDLGQVLGVGAHLSQLTRVAVGHFHLEDAHPLEALSDADAVRKALIAPIDALPHLPRWKPTPLALERLLHGNFVQAEHPLWTPGGFVIVTEDNEHIALIARWLPPLLRPVRVIRA